MPGGSVTPTSTTSSTSTGASIGSDVTPTAERACRPDSPKTSPSSSLAPLITAGWPVNPGSTSHVADDLDDPYHRVKADQRVDGR